MSDALWLVLGLVVGGTVAGAAAWFAARVRSSSAVAAAEARVDELATARELADTALERERERAREAEKSAEHHKASLEAERRALADQRASLERQLEESKRILVDVFRSVGIEELERTRERFALQASETLTPIRELLTRQERAIGELELRRTAAYAAIETQIKGMIGASEQIRTEASKLTTALKRGDARGRWGEVALRNLIELSGMTEHVDYDTQVHVAHDDGAVRPDLVVRMPGGGSIVVDAKVPLEHYLLALEQPEQRQRLLDEHARAVKGHIDALSSKAYWKQFTNAPGYVVMFIPVESALAAAFEARPDLQEYALRSRVILASSGIFLALLQAVALFWRHEDLTKNAQQISEVGAELYERLAKFATHLAKVGRSLEGAGKSYNDAIGSLEQRVLPSTRKLEALNVQLKAELESPESVAIEIRPIVAGELRAASEE